MREFLKQYLTEKQTVIYKKVTYGRWSLMRSGHYDSIDCTSTTVLFYLFYVVFIPELDLEQCYKVVTK